MYIEEIDKVAECLDNVLHDACKRHLEKHEHARDIEWYSFPQTWSSTALDFSRMGGQMVTTAQTYVIDIDYTCYIYFGGKFAYTMSRKDAQTCIAARNLIHKLYLQQAYFQEQIRRKWKI